MNINTAENLFSSSTHYIALNYDAIEDAQKRFIKLQEAGIIKDNSRFEDTVWYTTDQYSNIGLHFEFDEVSYQKHYRSLFQMNFNTFLDFVKVYLISLFGKNVLSSLANVLLDIRHIIGTNRKTLHTKKISLDMPWLCLDFFSMFAEDFADEHLDELIAAIENCCEEKVVQRGRHQRNLATFDTYFLFDEIIKKYWIEPLSVEERLFYYPIYLWWQITAVIPLRPREFILTERNCLSCQDGIYYLRLRRNHLKGGQSNITYTLDGDYDIFTCRIPESLALIIQEYLHLTSEYNATDIDTLFVTDVHYKKWGRNKHRNSRYLTYTNLNTILRYFYDEIISEKYGYKIVYEHDNSHLSDGEICFIHLGDTRHIALINIMQEGGTPVTAMQLAGHTNTEMASHYYTNLTQLIECKTYRQYRRMISGDCKFSISTVSYVPSAQSATSLRNGGKCYSKAYKNGEITDCLCSVGDNGEIGYCPKCIHYRCEGSSLFGSEDIFKRNLKDDCKLLVEAVELIRQSKGNVEDIGEVMLRLHSSSKSYQAYLLEKMQKGDNYGQTSTD